MSRGPDTGASARTGKGSSSRDRGLWLGHLDSPLALTYLSPQKHPHSSQDKSTAGTQQHSLRGTKGRTKRLPKMGIHPQQEGSRQTGCVLELWETQRGISLWEMGHLRSHGGGGGGERERGGQGEGRKGNSLSAWPSCPWGKFPAGKHFPILLPDFHSWACPREKKAESGGLQDRGGQLCVPRLPKQTRPSSPSDLRCCQQSRVQSSRLSQ